jgi:glycosyltransferase involved in cell wall biosynthesis
MRQLLRSESGRGLRGVRVAVINWRDPWHSLAGGSERYAWESAVALQEAGATVDFLTARDSHQTAKDLHAGIRILRGGSQLGFYAWVWWRLARLRVARRPHDVVIDAENGIPAFTPPLLPRSSAVVLVMHHVHQDQFRTYFPPPMAALGRWLEGRLMPRVYRHARVAAVSLSTVHEMRRQLGWRTPVQVIHNGADTPAHIGVQPRPEHVVVLGRLATHKRIDLVVRAVRRLVDERPGLRLDIVGKGPEEPRLRALVSELGLGDQITVHGFLDEDDKRRVLGSASFHVCASDAEGWGQVVIEAAAYGLPTLARDVPGLRDSIHDGHTGWLVDTRGQDDAGVVNALVSGMREALDQMDDPRESADLAQRCRDWADQFSWKSMHDSVVAIVEQELTARGR